MESFKSIVRSLCPPLNWRETGRLPRGPEIEPIPRKFGIACFRRLPGATPTVVKTLLGRSFRTADAHLFLAVYSGCFEGNACRHEAWRSRSSFSGPIYVVCGPDADCRGNGRREKIAVGE